MDCNIITIILLVIIITILGKLIYNKSSEQSLYNTTIKNGTTTTIIPNTKANTKANIVINANVTLQSDNYLDDSLYYDPEYLYYPGYYYDPLWYYYGSGGNQYSGGSPYYRHNNHGRHPDNHYNGHIPIGSMPSSGSIAHGMGGMGGDGHR
jgi:hypothetical protein